MIVWLDGQLLSVEQARIDPRDRGLLLADGLFETLLARQGRPVYLAGHLQRLRVGCTLLGIGLVATDAQLAEAIGSLLASNGLESGDAAVRLTLTRGVGPRGLRPPSEVRPTLLLSVAPATDLPGPANVVVSRFRRNEHSPLCAVKTLSNLDNVLAAREAASRGADEALLLNTAGQVVEGSATNLFWVEASTLCSPPVADGALPGIVRDRVLQIAARLQIRTREVSCEPQRLREADELFLTNSLVGIRPVARFEGQPVGSSCPGGLTQRLVAALDEDPVALS